MSQKKESSVSLEEYLAKSSQFPETTTEECLRCIERKVKEISVDLTCFNDIDKNFLKGNDFEVLWRQLLGYGFLDIICQAVRAIEKLGFNINELKQKLPLIDKSS